MASEQQDRRFLWLRHTRLIIIRVYHLFPHGAVQKCTGPLEEATPSLGEGRSLHDLLARDAVHQGSSATTLLQYLRVHHHD